MLYVGVQLKRLSFQTGFLMNKYILVHSSQKAIIRLQNICNIAQKLYELHVVLLGVCQPVLGVCQIVGHYSLY